MSEVKRYYSFFTSHPGDWRPCSKEHHDMVRANPQDWPGYEVRELAVIPAGHVVVSEGLVQGMAKFAREIICGASVGARGSRDRRCARLVSKGFRSGRCCVRG